MLHTNASPLPTRQRDQLWFRYVISLGVTALPATWATMGILPPQWRMYAWNFILLTSLLINVSRRPDPANRWWYWGGLRWFQFLVEFLLVALCFGIVLLFLREIPFARIRALVESTGHLWVLWSFLALGQLRECIIIVAQGKEGE